MIESPDFHDPVHGIPVFSLYGAVRRPTDADDRHVRRPARGSAGRRLPHLHVLDDAALRPRGRGANRKAVWVLDRPNPAGRPVEGLLLRDGWRASSARGRTDAPRPHARRARALVRAHRSSTSSSRSSRWRAGARRGARFGWPLGERAWVNPSPNAPSLRWRALSRDGDARGHDALRRPRDDAAARALRRARPRRRGLLAHDEALAPDWLAGCRLRLLVRADLPQARGRALRRLPDPRRRPRTTTRRSGPGACRARLQGDPPLRPDYPLWRTSSTSTSLAGSRST